MSNTSDQKHFRRYVIDGVEHHFYQDKQEEFKSIANSVGKQFKDKGFYRVSLSEYEQRRNNSQDKSKVYHPIEGLNIEAITGKQQTESLENEVVPAQVQAAKAGMKAVSEIAKIEDSIDQAIDNINENFQTLVERELNRVSNDLVKMDSLGNDLEECDLDTILVANNQWTSNMSLEDKQNQVVEIIKQLGEDSLEYKMALARRTQLTKTQVVKSLKSKLTKKTNITVKNKIQSETETFESSQSEAFQQDRYTSEEAINDIAEAKANRMFNKIEAKRQKQRDRVFDVLTVGVTSAVVDNCYPEFENAIKQHAATVSKLSSMLVEKAQLIDKKDPVQVQDDYNQIVRQVVKSVKEEGLPNVKPRTALDFQVEQEKETVSQSVS